MVTGIKLVPQIHSNNLKLLLPISELSIKYTHRIIARVEKLRENAANAANPGDTRKKRRKKVFVSSQYLEESHQLLHKF